MKTTTRNAIAIFALITFPATSLAGKVGAAPTDRPAPAVATLKADSGIDPTAVAAMAKLHGISKAEAAKRLGEQKSLGDKGNRLARSLGSHTGGAYLDEDGRLVVTALDATADAAAHKAGAKAQRVDDSAARLDTIMEVLNRKADTDGAGTVQGWRVDVPTNSVIVTVTKGSTDTKAKALTQLAARFGDSVRFEEAAATQAPKATEYMVGGYQYITPTGGSCSVGFNAVDAYNRNVIVTAGHCTATSGTMTRNNYWIGNTRTSNFPSDDYGTFWNSYPSYWQPTASVSKYNGTYMTVRGSWNAPVGATVCKSGRTTGWTCGTIRALNQTVNYGGKVVYGLVRHDACVEPGDSGGANMSNGGYALGLTSGASLSGGKCLAKLGGANVSWYQPIGEALTANGLRLLVA